MLQCISSIFLPIRVKLLIRIVKNHLLNYCQYRKIGAVKAVF